MGCFSGYVLTAIPHGIVLRILKCEGKQNHICKEVNNTQRGVAQFGESACFGNRRHAGSNPVTPTRRMINSVGRVTP